MSSSTNRTAPRGSVRKSSSLAAACSIVVALLGVSAFADGESLAETGGFVPTDAPVLAFKNITLADLGTTYVPSAKMSGGWVTADGMPVSFSVRTVVDGAVRYQAQAVEGSVKAVAIEFTDGEGGVYVSANVDQGFYNTDLTYFGKDIYNSSSTFAGAVATSADDGTYGIHDLGLVPVGDLDAICLNFNKDNNTILKTYEPVGPNAYAVTGFMWSQMLGTNNNTLNGVRLIDNETSATLDLPSVTVTITGTRGTYSWSGYNSDKDARYGYIDESADYPTPTVTITNIPFDYYKVVFIPSTDTGDSKFGYITVNGKNYSSDNKEKSTDRDYDIVADSTDAWGKTQVSNYLHGVNYLVTPVHANNGGKTLTVTGHKSGGRGCIAAIQIVKAEAPDTLYSVTATGDVTWSTKDGLTVNSGTWASGNTIILVNNQTNPVTVTFDETVDAAELILSGSGKTTIKFSDSSYNQIESFNFNGVTGEVVLDDYMQTVSFAPPATGAVRYKGVATLATVPCASGAIPYTVIVDQPLTVSEFQLADVKNDYRFGESFVGTFASRFVLGNNNGSNQSVTQMGGSITVNGDSENYNQSSILLGHWGSLTVNLNTYGGTFTAPNAAVRLGHTGKCYWTIGDGESVDDSTAVANLKGIRNTNGTGDNGGSGSRVVLQQGGTLNIGESGVNIPNATFTLAGGKLATTAASEVSITAGTVTSAADADTEINTVNGLTIASSIGGSGAITKTGSGTLTLSTTASSTGTLTVNEGTVNLPSGVTWGGAIVLGDNGTLNVVVESFDPGSTVYVPMGASLTVGNGTVTVNGTAIDTDIWELVNGTFVNKTLKTAITTATGDFAFSTATWESALGAGVAIDWSGSLSEVRVTADNAAPAVATVDVTAAEVKDFVVDGAGDVTFVAENGGRITAEAYNFSSAAGRVEYDLPTGNAPVVSGANTLLFGGGSGTPTVAAGKSLTLGPWGTTEDDETWTYTPMLRPTAGSTLLFAPGVGKRQVLSGGFGDTNTGTTIGVTNGTLVVDRNGGNDSVFFGVNSVRIDDGGIVSLEAQDALGYNNARLLTINKGGVLAVNVRDTLRRTVNFNGGKIEIKGAHSGRGLDFYGLVMNVTDNSSIDQLEAQSKVGMRRDTTVINMNDGKTLAINANLYPEQSNIGLTVRAADGQGNQNGVVQLNGYSESPKQTFNGTVTVGEASKAAMVALNCEHENGTYLVNSSSRLLGTGSVTGNGGVTLAAANSKVCGSLTINNLTAASGGTYGDQWNSVAAKVATSYFAAGTQTIENGSFTIGADCVVTNAANDANTTDATFSIAANGNLKLDKTLTVAGLTVADGGTITLGAASKNSVPVLNVAGDTSFAGIVNFIIDFGSVSTPGSRTYTLMTGTLPNLANVSVSDGRGEKKWKVFVDGGALKASSSGSFALRLR
ncbi:MAG: hypothetical protein II840_14415 [Kiritimatiellae bacterium]|nr:hypothetical protein [Kiritimatiellia bacterium]